MFTRLFFRSLVARFYGTISNFVYTNCLGAMGGTTGLSLSAFSSNFTDALGRFSTDYKNNINGNCIAFGNGNAVATIDDYNLSGETFRTYTATYVKSYNEDQTQMTWTYTITNSGTESFTIKEAGIFTYCYSSQASYTALMYREVLEEPITIEPGGVGQITLTFKVNIPEA